MGGVLLCGCPFPPAAPSQGLVWPEQQSSFEVLVFILGVLTETQTSHNRTMEAFMLENRRKVTEINHLSALAGPPPTHIPQCHIYKAFRSLQGRGLHPCLGQLCQAGQALKDFFLISSLNLPWYNCVAVKSRDVSSSKPSLGLVPQNKREFGSVMGNFRLQCLSLGHLRIQAACASWTWSCHPGLDLLVGKCWKVLCCRFQYLFFHLVNVESLKSLSSPSH